MIEGINKFHDVWVGELPQGLCFAAETFECIGIRAQLTSE
jgi:hypothetical protein